MSSDARATLIRRLREDLIGPGDSLERLRDRPSDVYLTGILYPQRHEYGPEEDERLGTEDSNDAPGSSDEEESSGLSHAMRPASAGISFALSVKETEKPELDVEIFGGVYAAVEEGDGLREEEDGKAERDVDSRSHRKRSMWHRNQLTVRLSLVLASAEDQIDLKDHGAPGLALFYKRSRWDDAWLVTLAMLNVNRVEPHDRRRNIEEKTFFQTHLRVQPGAGTRIRARPADGGGDSVSEAALLYRDSREFAVGHTCSAMWKADGEGPASEVSTSWIPDVLVPRTNSGGAAQFRRLRGRGDGIEPLSAVWLSEADSCDLVAGLTLLVEAYEEWVQEEKERLGKLPDALRDEGEQHLSDCGAVAAGIMEGVRTIQGSDVVRDAFRIANRAIQVQRSWLYPSEDAFEWRPFQLAFLLLNLPSITNRDHPDRETMDLLWFPTGGGKTEAYLSIVAFTIFFRRLRGPDPDEGAGVSVIMRYTLRLLTAQQFQRACALILACEYMRLGNELPEGVSTRFGSRQFGIGLWVGRDATPNGVKEAIEALRNRAPNTPAQLERCPACGSRLRWRHSAEGIRVSCQDAECVLTSVGDLPVWTVDEDIYREVPALLIGTADKFAQIVRKQDTGRLFSVGSGFHPPELIIQDELHLITGPLGTMAGLYEVAIDALCSQGGPRPKLIGSTATIRRAEPQIRSLFDRRTRQFPPPGLDAGNSGFAVVDESRPGRIYLGVTTAGRSAKFTLQAVSASLLQGAVDRGIIEGDRDGYWTLVSYFNSLRELGGALVLMQDDVGASMEGYAGRRSEAVRPANIIEELTSRRSQIEIRDKLEELKRTYPDPGAIDALLATNMISVGVDIPRLGLMVVNGQPKAMAEYIQATSRVGRSDTPGLIVSIYNNAKARDRSHYETFSTWHKALYREVEASSVTPFASRARDRALHAPLVAILRHTVEEMRGSPRLPSHVESTARKIADFIAKRADRVDPEESQAVRAQLDRIIAEWMHRSPLSRYWDDRRTNTSLLISAEKAASMRAAGRLPGSAWPTPNSLRNVDPGSPFILVPRLKPDPGNGAEVDGEA